jgi:aryl-alcohol dehydrogenase-like predicted oxidoreductase
MGFGGTGWAETIGRTDVRGAARQLDLALEAGVNLVDTADVYSSGLAEEILGQALGSRRDEVLLATKVRFPVGTGPNDAGLSRHHILRSCEASLRRLGTDHIDLYQVHGWDGQTDLDETLSTLDALVTSGKVRYIGASNHSAWHLVKALGVSERRGLERYASHQVYYSLHAREAEHELVPAALDQQLGILVWSPLSGGLLTGRFRRDRARPEGSRQSLNWGSPPVHDEERFYDLVDVLVRVAEGRGATPAQVALAWVAGRPAVSSVVVGARTEEQLADCLAAAELELTREEVAALDEASATPLPYPYWHQAEIASDRLGDADLSLLGSRVAGGDR